MELAYLWRLSRQWDLIGMAAIAIGNRIPFNEAAITYRDVAGTWPWYQDWS